MGDCDLCLAIFIVWVGGLGGQEKGCFALCKIKAGPSKEGLEAAKAEGCPEERSGEAPPHVGVLDKINEAFSECDFSAGEDGERRSGLAGGLCSIRDIFLESIKSSQNYF